MPIIKVKMNVRKIMVLSGEFKSSDIFLASRNRAPIDAGIKRANEKLKASIGLRPMNRAELMVAPERDTAGTIAKA